MRRVGIGAEKKTTELEALQAANRDLEEKVKAQQERNEMLQSENEELTEEIKDLNAENVSLKAENEGLQRKLMELNKPPAADTKKAGK